VKDVRRDPWDFRYRVVGTIVREHSRHNWTGKWMSEVEGQGEGSRVFSVMRWVSEKGKAAVMPWCNDDEAVDRVLVAVDFLMN
jgi:hypothetical protein